MATKFVRFQYSEDHGTKASGPVAVPAPAATSTTGGVSAEALIAAAKARDERSGDAGKDSSGTPVTFVSPKFTTVTARVVPDTIGDGHSAGFRVNPLVAQELGLEEKEKARIEAEIEKEIARRWIETKEKSEVEGYTTGLNTGKREAYTAEKPRIEERLKRLDTLLNHVDTMRERIFVDNEDFLMQLLSQILKAITLKEIELDKDYLRRLVLHLIAQLNEKSDLVIMISAQDAQNIQVLSEAISQKFGELKGLKIHHSPDVEAGSCRIESKTVVLDASIGEQIQNAMKVLSQPKAEST